MSQPPPAPEFPRYDPATAAFWDVRFEGDFTPWDQGGVPQSLVDYMASAPSPGRVLIPGCGAAHEVRFLAERGWDVAAVDFSLPAVLRAKQALGPLADRVVQADFFGPALHEAHFDVIYERAFLCALPLRMRGAWAERMAALLPAGGRLLGFFYFDDAPKGPPFGIDRAQLQELLSPNFMLAEERAPTDSIAVFAGKEKWQVWVRRG